MQDQHQNPLAWTFNNLKGCPKILQNATVSLYIFAMSLKHFWTTPNTANAFYKILIILATILQSFVNTTTTTSGFTSNYDNLRRFYLFLSHYNDNFEMVNIFWQSSWVIFVCKIFYLNLFASPKRGIWQIFTWVKRFSTSLPCLWWLHMFPMLNQGFAHTLQHFTTSKQLTTVFIDFSCFTDLLTRFS